MNKKAQSNFKISSLLIAGGVALIVLGMITWQPIAYLGVLVFVVGIATKNFMDM